MLIQIVVLIFILAAEDDTGCGTTENGAGCGAAGDVAGCGSIEKGARPEGASLALMLAGSGLFSQAAEFESPVGFIQ